MRLALTDVAGSPVPWAACCRCRSRSNRRSFVVVAARPAGDGAPPARRSGGGVKRLPDRLPLSAGMARALGVRMVVRAAADGGRAGARPRPRAGRRTSIDGPHRRIALENLAHAFPGAAASERRALAQAMFAHFGGLLLELIKFGTYSPRADAGGGRSEGEERVRQAHQQGRGVLFFTGHFGYWEMQAIVARAARASRSPSLARPLDNPHLHAMLEEIRTRTGNTVIYRQGAVRRMLRELAAGRGIAHPDRSASPHADAVYVGLLPAAGGHDVRAGRARAAHRRAGDSGVRAAAAARPLPLHLRASGRSAAGRHARRRPRIHAAVHRRPGDVRAPASRPVAVDAPPLAGSRRARRRVRAGYSSDAEADV